MSDKVTKMQSDKVIVGRASFVRMSPRKLRLVARALTGLTPERAVATLKMINQRAANPIRQVLQQAIANAKNNFALSPGDLIMHSVQIQEGPRGAKRMDKSHGARFDRGIKRRRLAHILIRLSVKEK